MRQERARTFRVQGIERLPFDEAEVRFHVDNEALKCLARVKRAKHIFVLLPGVHLRSAGRSNEL